MSHPFDRDTAVAAQGAGRYGVELSADWWGYSAAHGGYLGAILLRAAQAHAANEARGPRSLHLHYLRGPAPGPAEVQVATERQGGRVSVLSARLLQGGQVVTLATVTLGVACGEESFQDVRAPAAPPPEQVESQVRSRVAIDHRFEHRPCLGARPFSGAGRAAWGGWARLAGGDRPLDAPALVALCDSFWPSLFSKLVDKRQAGAVPTLDLAVHFHSGLSQAGPSGWALFELETPIMREGYAHESCRMWSPEGDLLAASVQHALRIPPRRG